MKGAIRRKLIEASLGATMALVCLTTTTYAWFAKNANAWVDEFKVDIRQDEGLLISVDGKNWYDSIYGSNAHSSNSIYKAIVAKRLNKAYDDVTYSDLYPDENASEEAKSAARLRLSSVSTKDLKTFTTVDSKSTVEDETVNGVTTSHYVPREIEANEFEYVSFDLYFKAEVATYNAYSKYKLTFTPSNLDNTERGVSKVTSSSTYHTLYNDLTYKNAAGEVMNLHPGDHLYTNTANAMRIGILHSDNETATIYEPNIGYSSYALSGNQNDIYNPSYNPMLTYFNSSHNSELKPLDDLDVYKNTQKDFEAGISFGTFEPQQDGEYNILKITVFLWLEGYDGDYLPTTNSDYVYSFLNFTKIGLEE